MFELKPIAKESIARALAKVERYRLLGEPGEAESICRDVLDADPGNQEALVCMILTHTDQFDEPHSRPDEARGLLGRLCAEYERLYYAGVIDERWGKALLHGGYPRETVFPLIRSAMQRFEAAEKIAPEGNDDAVLRWNACVRLIATNRLAASGDGNGETPGVESFDDDVPVR